MVQELKCGDVLSRTNTVNLFPYDHLLPDPLTLMLQTHSAALTSACPEGEQSCGRPRPVPGQPTVHLSSCFFSASH